MFCLAAGYLLKKFIWLPFIETLQKKKGKSSKCGKNNCGCH
jgi:hypothetical protein